MADAMKRALVTGITGQDGSYLAELLVGKGYEVHGLVRRTSTFHRERIDHLRVGAAAAGGRVVLHYGDMADGASLHALVRKTRPDELYNLAAQSHVGISFEMPEYSADIDGLGMLRILEAVREERPDCRVYQASSSELFGAVEGDLQGEATQFRPVSPYACAKAFAYYIVQTYRRAYGMYCSNGILFNHESPRRGENFVTRKVTTSLGAILRGERECIVLGNLDARRDWGFAGDYVEAMWLMLQQDKPDDYLVATGEEHSVREFVAMACRMVGIRLRFQGTGVEEVGVDAETGKVIVRVSPKYFRPADVEYLKGDMSRTKERLGWAPRTSFEELVRMMVAADVPAEYMGEGEGS